ncbi:MAG: hypothetical protein AB1500_01535 [Bacillota bacterium]
MHKIEDKFKRLQSGCAAGTITLPDGTVIPPGDRTPQTPPAPVVPPDITQPPAWPVPGQSTEMRRGPPPWNRNYVKCHSLTVPMTTWMTTCASAEVSTKRNRQKPA